MYLKLASRHNYTLLLVWAVGLLQVPGPLYQLAAWLLASFLHLNLTSNLQAKVETLQVEVRQLERQFRQTSEILASVTAGIQEKQQQLELQPKPEVGRSSVREEIIGGEESDMYDFVSISQEEVELAILASQQSKLRKSLKITQ